MAFNGRGVASDFLEHEKTGLLPDYDLDDDALYRRISRNAQEYAKKNLLADGC